MPYIDKKELEKTIAKLRQVDCICFYVEKIRFICKVGIMPRFVLIGNKESELVLQRISGIMCAHLSEQYCYK